MEEEFNAIAGSEVEVLKQTVADKDREIAELSGELQTLQAQLQTVSKYPSEEEEEEEMYKTDGGDLRPEGQVGES